MNRRTLMQSALSGLIGSAVPVGARFSVAEGTEPYDFGTLVERARTIASDPYRQPASTLSEPFADLTYDQFRAIRFRDDTRLFADGDRPFRMDLMPPGFQFQNPVMIHLVSDGQARPLTFSTDFFRFHENYFPYPDGRAPDGLEGDMGFSGVRFRHPFNRPGVWDEFAVFQGASYFRAVARDTLYGLSARGLAIATAGSEPEEFPQFSGLWVHEPQRGETVLRVDALLDGPSVAGAFAFAIEPGAQTAMDIEAILFPRRDIADAGLAPLTSMYFFGPESRAGIDDFRDAVHDSSGLRIVTGTGERLWRPLRNPPNVEVSAFADSGLRSFGLIQRDREFEHFQDAEALYEQRPSAWVEPREDWASGAVMLFELPTTDDFADNIVAFWRPDEPLRKDEAFRYSYRLSWGQLQDDALPQARVVATRGGVSIHDKRERVFVVDFDLGQINFETVTPKLSANAGTIKGLSKTRLPGTNTARVGFHFVPGGLRGAEFRLTLESAGRTASEVWLYRWTA